MSPKEKAVTLALPADFNLPCEYAELEGRDGRRYLEFTTHMVTFYRQTYGEHSAFFLGLREGKLLGARCPGCGQVMVPAAATHCPNCDFKEMSIVELPQRGILAFTAPITIFPSASFAGEAPFARGYVDVALEAPAASYLMARLRTTTGLERPGIFVKGKELKLVFEDERVGSIRDIFFVPMDEVPRALRGKEPLLASELDFETPKPPEFARDRALGPARDAAVVALKKLAADIETSPRAQADLARRSHLVGVHSQGGDFGFRVADSRLVALEALPENPDFLLVCEDPAVFTRWVHDGSLTDAAVEGSLWLPGKAAFQLLPILDRLPRSTRRDRGSAKR